MHTIVLATQKGGSGKTTLSIGLALAARQAGFSVRLIETDPQGTLASWRRRRTDSEPVVEPIYGHADIKPRLAMLAESGLQLAIIDTAAGINEMTAAAIACSDLCLIPARPTMVDIEATISTLSVVRSYKRPFSFVLNQAPIRGQRIDQATSTLGDEAATQDLGDVLARPLIAMRNDHQDSLAAGLAVTEFAPGSKSADEIRGLWQWVAARLPIAVAPTLDVVSPELSSTDHLLPSPDVVLTS